MAGVEGAEQQDCGVQVGEQPVDLHAGADRQEERKSLIPRVLDPEIVHRIRIRILPLLCKVVQTLYQHF